MSKADFNIRLFHLMFTIVITNVRNSVIGATLTTEALSSYITYIVMCVCAKLCYFVENITTYFGMSK